MPKPTPKQSRQAVAHSNSSHDGRKGEDMTNATGTTACEMTDEQRGLLEGTAFMEGANAAEEAASYGASLGAAREAAIAAFTKGYDAQAEALMEVAA